jgi:hypothetical protein
MEIKGRAGAGSRHSDFGGRIMPLEVGGHMDSRRAATVIGAFGLGAVFSPLVLSVVRASVEAQTMYLFSLHNRYLSAEFSAARFALPAILLVALVVGFISGRFGWLVAAAALLAFVGLRMAGVEVGGRQLDSLALLGLCGAIALGGGLGAFGASTEGRLGWAWGFAAGASGGYVVSAVLMSQPFSGYLWRHAELLVILPFAVLCLIAAVVWLVVGPGPSPAKPTHRWGAVAVVPGVAVVAIVLRLAMDAALDGVYRERLLNMNDTGRAVLAMVAALAFAGYAYRRGGVPAARWVLLGLGFGLAATTGGTRELPLGWQWQAPLVVIAGAVAGVVVVRWARKPIRWDAIALVGLALLVVLGSPRGLQGMDALASGLVGYAVSFTMTFALATGLGLLGSEPEADLIGVAVGLAALLTTVAVVWRSDLFYPRIATLSLPNAIALGVAALAALAVARLAPPLRSASAAEAAA